MQLRLSAMLGVFTALSVHAAEPALTHPDTTGAGWVPLFTADLSNAQTQPGVWTVGADGVITASKDEALWTQAKYKDFILDLEFKNAPDTNSGVIVHASDTGNWIPNSVEIQIADDHGKWGKENPTFRCGAIFGHLAASKQVVKTPGEWNHYTVTCIDRKIWVVLNGELVTQYDMSLWTSAKTNPDGTAIPPWLSRPKAELPLEGRIGLQGKHAGAPIWFRNLKIKAL
ncbi:MAG: DUF1080 domain-containing protein [Kiritimatiellia bacterium]